MRTEDLNILNLKQKKNLSLMKNIQDSLVQVMLSKRVNIYIFDLFIKQLNLIYIEFDKAYVEG